MTGQVSHTVQFHDEEYKVLAVYPDEPFTPEHIGLTTRWVSTSCFGGYLCKFEVADKQFRLRSLELSLRAEDGEAEFLEKMPQLFGKSATLPEPYASNVGEYLNLNYQLPFSGEILFGRFDEDLRASWHGYTRAWECEEVWHLVSSNGCITKVKEVSDIFERFRELYVIQFCDIGNSEYAKGKSASDEYTIHWCLPENRKKYRAFLKRRFGHRFDIY